MAMRWSMMGAAGGLLLVSAAAAGQTPQTDAVRRLNGEIQFANYPRESLARGEQGVVGIDVTTDRQGRLRSCRVVRSSGFPLLDAATCDLLITHLRMKPFLAPGGGGVVRRQQGQVVWKLPADYKGPIATPAAAGRLAAADRKVCHVQARTGSLVGSQRICLTRNEWQRQYQHAQDEAQDMKPKFLPGDPNEVPGSPL